jgi:hypothetical protein
MRTDTDDLPPLDPTRSHLDILRNALDMMREYQPTREDVHGQGLSDCAECGFPLDGNVSPNAGPHSQEDPHHLYRGRCKWLVAVAELEAWVRVEEEIEASRPEI